MNTESYRGYRAKIPILDDYLISLDEIYEIINGSSIEVKPHETTITIINGTLCIN